MPDLLKAAEKVAKTVRTVFLAAVDNAGFLLEGFRSVPEEFAEFCFGTVPLNEWGDSIPWPPEADLDYDDCPPIPRNYADCTKCGAPMILRHICTFDSTPGGFRCLAPPFECLGCVTTSDCTWPQNSAAVPAAADAAPESEAQDGGSGSEEIDAFPRVPSEPHPDEELALQYQRGWERGWLTCAEAYGITAGIEDARERAQRLNPNPEK